MDHSIRVLTATITKSNLDQTTHSVEVEITVAAALIECLLAFLKGLQHLEHVADDSDMMNRACSLRESTYLFLQSPSPR